MPYRLRLHGDTDSAKLLLPTARRVLDELNRDMAFNSLGQLQKTVKLASGAIIKVTNILGQEVVDITFPEVEPVIPPVIEEEYTSTVNFVVIEVKNPVYDSKYIIWDVSTGALADAFILEEYPITEEDVEGWAASTLAEDVTEVGIYSVVLAGETSGNELGSANTGCGALTNTLSNYWGYYGFYDVPSGPCGYQYYWCCVEPREWYDGAWHGTWETCPECGAVWGWYDQLRWYDMKAFILGPMKSYNLTIQVPGAFINGTTCVRNHAIIYEREYDSYVWQVYNSDYDECSPSELPAEDSACYQYGDVYDCTLKSPLGDFTALYLYDEVAKRWIATTCGPSSYNISKEWLGYDVPINLTAFSGEVFVQLFGYWGRQIHEQRTSTTYNVVGDIKGAVNEYKSTLEIDPRLQEENADFTSIVNTLITDYISNNDLDFTTANEAIDLEVKIYEVPEENA